MTVTLLHIRKKNRLMNFWRTSSAFTKCFLTNIRSTVIGLLKEPKIWIHLLKVYDIADMEEVGEKRRE